MRKGPVVRQMGMVEALEERECENGVEDVDGVVELEMRRHEWLQTCSYF